MTPAIFAKSKKHRDKKCVNKDVIVRSIIRALKILDPRNFFAMLMPNLYGIEIFLLHNHGVPSSNIYAVERDPDVHQILKHPSAQQRHLLGIKTTSQPSPVCHAIDDIYFEQKKFDFIYLDFYSRTTVEHILAIQKIIGLHMIKAGGTIMFTFGKTRCNECTKLIERTIEPTGKSVVKYAIDSEIAQWEHPRYRSFKERDYISIAGHNQRIQYTTSTFRF